jgi:O-acetyl-ADP-ribose deacetylase (regulator of RNase III)
MIRRGTGNLLHSDADALVNTVNCVGVMGKGIALQFKKAWPEMFKAYKAAADAGEVRPGHIHVWPTGQLRGPRFILNFPTKRHWRSKSRLEDVDAGLDALARLVEELGIRSVAVPPLGAGNGGLDWQVVRPRICRALETLEDVTVMLWEPGHAPPPASRPVRTPRPRWTPARAAVMALMGQYGILDDDLTQLEVQKLAYFLQVAGEELRLRYAKHHYGPYADGLYHMLQTMEGHFIRGLEDRRPDAVLELDHAAVDEARMQVAKDQALQARFERVSRLIEGFETPYGMELLSTVHWVASRDADARASSEGALGAVREWSRSKRSRMRPQHVRVAWTRLHDQGWLSAA